MASLLQSEDKRKMREVKSWQDQTPGVTEAF